MIQFCEFDKEFLRYSWDWLHDPEIKYLTNTHDFDKDTQNNWFENLKSKNDYLIYGIKYNGIPIGACGLKNITEYECEYWGYIGDKKYWGKGFGKMILSEMVKRAKDIQKKKIYLKVIKSNSRAIKLYESYGFKTEESGISEHIMTLFI